MRFHSSVTFVIYKVYTDPCEIGPPVHGQTDFKTGTYEIYTECPISYPEPSLSGSGHTGLKNDPDWSIHKLLDPYPLWRSHARPIWVNTIYIFCFVLPENVLILTNFLLLFVRKSGEGIKELICAYLNSFGQNNSFVMVIIHTLGSLWVSISVFDGMMAYVLDLLYWSVIIEKKFKRTRLASVHVCCDCVCTRFWIF
jgi:hypothetical protein